MTIPKIIATDKNIHEIVIHELIEGMHAFLETGKPVSLNHIDVSAVTNMDHLFCGHHIGFDISTWDVSNVISMRHMFELSGWSKFDISNWNVSKVTNMNGIFNGSLFDGDISKWTLNSRCETANAINVYQLRNGHPSELAYMNRAQATGNYDYTNATNEYWLSKLKMGCRVGTFSDPGLEKEFMTYAIAARNIHAAFNSTLYGSELGRLAWELRKNDKEGSNLADSIELPDGFEFDLEGV